MEALHRVQLAPYFTQRKGGQLRIIGHAPALVKKGNPNLKGLRVRNNLRSCNVPANHALFVDDSPEICSDVAESNPGIATINCQPGVGITPQIMQSIIAHFQTCARSPKLGLLKRDPSSTSVASSNSNDEDSSQCQIV